MPIEVLAAGHEPEVELLQVHLGLLVVGPLAVLIEIHAVKAGEVKATAEDYWNTRSPGPVNLVSREWCWRLRQCCGKPWRFTNAMGSNVILPIASRPVATPPPAST